MSVIAKLSQNFIELVKSSIDIVELISRYTPLTNNGSVYIGKCPRPKDHEHGVDTSPSFRVMSKTQSWFCGACHCGEKDMKSKHHKNYGSDCIAFMQWYYGIEWYPAILKLAEMYDIPVEIDQYAELYEQQYFRAQSYHANLSEKMKQYLADRGVTPETIKLHCIGFNGKELTFPLLNRQKQYIGFTKRSFDPDEPKYKNSYNSKIFHKSSYLYGIHLVVRDEEEIRISEGAFDMIIPTQYGVKNMVSTLGTSFTDKHVELIRNLGKIPVLCMDGDKAGLRSIRRAADLLAAHNIYCKILLLPEGMDMADIAVQHKEETENYIKHHSIPYGTFLMQELLKEYEAKMDELNLTMIPRFRETLQQIKHPDEKKMVQDRIFRNTGLRL